ncbi:MAG: SDR family oxidoreductase, partial [Bacteroidota bacterium]
MTLTDRVAVVTGASRGIGLACAEAFLDAGMQVYALARSSHNGYTISQGHRTGKGVKGKQS